MQVHPPLVPPFPYEMQPDSEPAKPKSKAGDDNLLRGIGVLEHTDDHGEELKQDSRPSTNDYTRMVSECMIYLRKVWNDTNENI